MSDDSPQQLSPKRRSRELRFVEALGRPLRRFLRIQAAGGILLLGATVSALIWANSSYSDVYHEILETPHFDRDRLSCPA